MHLKEALKKFLESIGADTRSALVGYFLGVLIVAGGGISALYKTSREWMIQTLTTATPIWATISLALLGCLCIYLKFRQLNVSFNPSNTVDFTTSEQTIEDRIWEIKTHTKGNIDVEWFPRCAKHDYKFISISGGGIRCPEKDCTNIISASQHADVYATAKSYIEKTIRDEKLSLSSNKR